ncbi:hypothetical protein EGI22_03215 [Lacihabitans sp. LS3-19]|uniref:hypothetical protein n=1 Tax=Lacihabitans sp. LS3-19 TaxID=2487335 RepID=UPI0020CBFFEE|nr:hypothetical protein [Lacihabitans sp. LS3-19]MCP9766903.1 hypothetical protein [Lacihabitans sp. LS3-19]
MKEVLLVFQKSIIWNYYRKNSLFILVVILFSFGFLSGQEHKTFVKSALKSWYILSFIFLGWSFYAFKTYLFVLRTLNQPDFWFLFNIRLLPFRKRIWIWFIVQFSLIQLTFSYAVFMAIMGALQMSYFTVGAILLVNFILIIFGVFIFEKRTLSHPEKENKLTNIFSFQLKFPKPYLLFYPNYLLVQEPILLLLSKAFSILSLLFVIWLFPTDEYDKRLFGMFAVIIAAAHLKIVSEWVYFKHKYLQFYRNLPLSFLVRNGYVMSGYLIIIVPEFFIFLMQKPIGISVFFNFSWLIFIISLLFLSHQFIYVNTISEESKMQWYFFAFVGLLILVLFKIPLLFLSVIFILLSIFINLKYFNSSEY